MSPEQFVAKLKQAATYPYVRQAVAAVAPLNAMFAAMSKQSLEQAKQVQTKKTPTAVKIEEPDRKQEPSLQQRKAAEYKEKVRGTMKAMAMEAKRIKELADQQRQLDELVEKQKKTKQLAEKAKQKLDQKTEPKEKVVDTDSTDKASKELQGTIEQKTFAIARKRKETSKPEPKKKPQPSQTKPKVTVKARTTAKVSRKTQQQRQTKRPDVKKIAAIARSRIVDKIRKDLRWPT